MEPFHMLLSATGRVLNLRPMWMSADDFVHDMILLQREDLQQFY
jgi:hypothetical protein